MLNQYLTNTALLLQNPAAPQSLYPTSSLTNFINQARGQLAGDAECIRVFASLPLTPGQRTYPFSSIDTASVEGISGVFQVRQALFSIASGMVWVRPRPFEWFTFYRLNNPVPQPGQPNEWAQFAQGEAGSVYIDPVPDIPYTMNLDTVCVPVPLVDDSTPEAIPYPWTDCVPYFAAYLAFLASQVPARQADGDRMLQRYEEFKNRARRYSTPDVLPSMYPQNLSPVRQNQLGIAKPQGGQ